VKPLDAAGRARLVETAQEMAGQALRVLAVAMRQGETHRPRRARNDLPGLLGMIDPPRRRPRRPSDVAKPGIKAVMITGDHPLTAQGCGHGFGMLKPTGW
jgi:Ca2+-transporting ATPase